MKRVIFGISPFSLLVSAEMKDDGIEVDAFTVNKDFLPNEWNQKIPIVSLEELGTFFKDDDFEVIITVGYKQMNENRMKAYKECKKYGYSIGEYIHSTSICNVEKRGIGNVILSGCKLHKYSNIGDFNIFVDDTIIGHESEVGSFNFFAGMTTGGMVKIGNNCFFGMKSVVNNNLCVGDYTLLGAGTVLTDNCDGETVIMQARNRTIKMNRDTIGNLLV